MPVMNLRQSGCASHALNALSAPPEVGSFSADRGPVTAAGWTRCVAQTSQRSARVCGSGVRA